MMGEMFRYVLRKVLSSTWGDCITWNSNECLLKYETAIDSSWNVDKLSAVAFIHRYNPQSPIDCQVYTAGSSILPQYGRYPDDSEFTTTGLSTIGEGLGYFDIYTIAGVKIRSNATDFIGIPDGLYIVNGRKVNLIRNRR